MSVNGTGPDDDNHDDGGATAVAYRSLERSIEGLRQSVDRVSADVATAIGHAKAAEERSRLNYNSILEMRQDLRELLREIVTEEFKGIRAELARMRGDIDDLRIEARSLAASAEGALRGWLKAEGERDHLIERLADAQRETTRAPRQTEPPPNTEH